MKSLFSAEIWKNREIFFFFKSERRQKGKMKIRLKKIGKNKTLFYII